MSASEKQRWKPEEDEIMKEFYPKEGPMGILARLPNRSKKAILYRGRQVLGLQFVKKWTEEEYQILRDYYPVRGQGYVASKLGRSRDCVKAMAQRLGLKGRPNWRTEIKEGNGSYRGHQELSGTRWSIIRSNATVRSIEFNITIEYAWDLYERQNRMCALSGVPIWFLSNRATSDGTASLDRIDSSKGYIEGNVQWLHVDVNRMKWDLSQDDFIDYCYRVVSIHPKLYET